MNIAIVEDRQEDAENISLKIKDYMLNLSISHDFFFYSEGEAFVAALPNVTFDIVFMDIYLSEMTGMEAAQILRQYNRRCKLIFLTSYDGHARQGYSVDACHYLLKPVEDTAFEEAMNNCHLHPRFAVPCLEVSSNYTPLTLNTELITHIDISKRIVQIHTDSQVIPVSGSFKSIVDPLLKDPRFLLIMRGIVVNMDYISNCRESVFVLQNGEQLPINLRNRRQIISVWRNYVFGQLTNHNK